MKLKGEIMDHIELSNAEFNSNDCVIKNKDIIFTTGDNQKIRTINLDEKELSVITIGEILIVIGDKSVRISIDDKNIIHKQNEIFINRVK
jgi:hypothetical protein